MVMINSGDDVIVAAPERPSFPGRSDQLRCSSSEHSAVNWYVAVNTKPLKPTLSRLLWLTFDYNLPTTVNYRTPSTVVDYNSYSTHERDLLKIPGRTARCPTVRFTYADMGNSVSTIVDCN